MKLMFSIPMPTDNKREAILQQAESLFRRQGYHHTSMNDVAGAAGIQKGSLYHHFDNKEALMEEVLRAGRRSFARDILTHAYDQSLPPAERMERIFHRVQTDYLTDEGGCIMGNIGLETSSTMPRFRTVIQEFFRQWMDAFEAIFEERYGQEKARQYAERSVEELEGAIMLCRIFDDNAYIERALQRVLAQL